MCYGKELDILAQAVRKEYQLSGEPRYRVNVVKSMIDTFTKRYITVELTFTLAEVDTMLRLLRSDGGPLNSVETDLTLKLAFVAEAFITE